MLMALTGVEQGFMPLCFTMLMGINGVEQAFMPLCFTILMGLNGVEQAFRPGSPANPALVCWGGGLRKS